MKLTKVLCSATVFALVATPTSAIAQTASCAEIDATIQRTNAMRQAGRDADAVALLRPLLTCGPNPRLRATLGLAELAAALWVQGFQHLSSALGATGDAWVTPRRATLQAALDQARIHVGYLEVSANVPGAELRIGGEMVATLPMSGPLRVAAGTLTYELSADGYVSELRRVEVAGNDVLTREHVLLAPGPAEVSRPMVSPTLTPASATRAASAIEPTPPTTSYAHQIIGWSMIGVAAVGIGVGVWATLSRDDSIDAFNNNPYCRTVSQRETDGCVQAQSATDRLLPLMVASYAAAGALAIAGAVLVATATSARPTQGALRCAPGLLSVGCEVRF